MASTIFQLVGRITLEGVKQLDRGLATIDSKLKSVEKSFTDFGKKAEEAGKKVAEVGEAATAFVTGPIVAAGGAAVLTATQWDTAAAQMANAFGLTTEEAATFTETAKNIWAEGFGSSDEVVNTISLIGQNLHNLPAEDLERITTLTLAFNKAMGTDAAETTRTMNTMMMTFGITAEEALDLMTYGMQNGANISGDLMDVLNEYSPQFKNMGYSANEFIAMLVRGSQNGMFSMDKLGDAVKESFLKISEGGDEQTKWLDKMGLDTKKVMDDIAAGGDRGQAAFMSIMGGIAAIPDEADRTAAAIALMGTPIEDLGPQYVEFFAQAEEGLTGLGGGTQKLADNQEQTFGQRFQSMLNKTALALQPLGEVILKMAEEYMPKFEAAVEKLANWFGSLSASQKEWMVILGLAAAAFGPLMIVMGNVIRVFGLFTGGFGKLAGLFVRNADGATKIGTAMSRVSGIFTKTAGVIRMLAGGALKVLQLGFNFVTSAIGKVISVAMRIGSIFGSVLVNAVRIFGTALRFLAMTPMGLIITAVMAAIAIGIALYKNWDTVKAYLMAAWTVIKNAFQSGVNTAIQFVTKLYTGAVSKFNSLRTTASTAFNTIKTAIVSKVREAATGAVNFFQNLYTGARDKFNSMLSTAKSVFGKVKSAITKPIEEAKTTVSGIIDNIIGFFDDLKGKFKFPKIDIPIPKISLTTATKNVLGKDITYPTGFDVDWYDKGGIFDSPSIIGVGEKRPEFVGALDDLRQIVREESGGGGGTLTVEIPLYLNGVEIARAVAPNLDTELERRKQRDARARGRRI